MNTELNVSNEGIMDSLKEALNKVKDFFKGAPEFEGKLQNLSLKDSIKLINTRYLEYKNEAFNTKAIDQVLVKEIGNKYGIKISSEYQEVFKSLGGVYLSTFKFFKGPGHENPLVLLSKNVKFMALDDAANELARIDKLEDEEKARFEGLLPVVKINQGIGFVVSVDTKSNKLYFYMPKIVGPTGGPTAVINTKDLADSISIIAQYIVPKDFKPSTESYYHPKGLIRKALEECQACQAAASGTVNTVAYKNPHGKHVNHNQKGFTYDDGKGIKENVIISGPLSEVYTKALNISLKKETLQEEVEVPLDPSDTIDTSIGNGYVRTVHKPIIISNENQVEDSEVETIVASMVTIPKQELTTINEKFDFVTMDKDPDNVVANIALIPLDKAKEPEVVQKLNTYQEVNKNQDTILVVTVPTQYGSEGTEVKNKFVNLGTDEVMSKLDLSEQYDTKVAFENLYETNGIKVYYGLEGFKEAIRYLAQR